MLKRFEWIDAQSAQEASSQASSTVADSMSRRNEKKAGPTAVIKAGGIDLLDLMKDGVLSTDRVVNIRNIKGMGEIAVEKNGLRIGPLVTLAQLAEHKEIQKRYTALSDACSHIATPNIRNAATIGGNLLQRPRCWYLRAADFTNCHKKGGQVCDAIHGDNKYHAVFGNDLCAIVHPSTAAVALVALEAKIEITSLKGTREIKLEDFFVTPETDVLRENILARNELITAIRLPDADIRSAHIKMGEKDSFDWSTGDCAVSLVVSGNTCKSASIILGAAAPVPWRAREGESYLAGKSLNLDTARAAGEQSVKGAKPLSMNEYKVTMLRVAVTRAILKAAGV